jgi:hypothetical protein
MNTNKNPMSHSCLSVFIRGQNQFLNDHRALPQARQSTALAFNGFPQSRQYFEADAGLSRLFDWTIKNTAIAPIQIKVKIHDPVMYSVNVTASTAATHAHQRGLRRSSPP